MSTQTGQELARTRWDTHASGEAFDRKKSPYLTERGPAIYCAAGDVRDRWNDSGWLARWGACTGAAGLCPGARSVYLLVAGGGSEQSLKHPSRAAPCPFIGARCLVEPLLSLSSDSRATLCACDGRNAPQRFFEQSWFLDLGFIGRGAITHPRSILSLLKIHSNAHRWPHCAGSTSSFRSTG